MAQLVHKSHEKIPLKSLFSLESKDLQFVLKDGLLSTSKLLVMTAFPQLREYVPDWIVTYDNIRIILPDHNMLKVREALVKMVMSGDGKELGEVLGIEQTKNVKDEEGSTDDLDDKDTTVMEDIIEEKYNKGDFSKQIDTFKEDRHIDVSNSKDNNLSRKTIKSSDQLKCNECSMVFKSKRNLKGHITTAHIRPVSCDRCKSVFVGKHNYQIHYKDCFYHCDRCEYVHKEEYRIEPHRRTHTQQDRKAQLASERIVVVYN